MGHVIDGPLSAPAAPSPLNLSTLMVFLTWFGAAGYLLRTNGTIAAISLLVATIVGGTGAILAWAFLAKVLWRGQTQLDPYNYRIEGTVARVTAAIRSGGTGEIIYTLDGKRRVDGARCEADSPIAAGADVAILRYEDGLAYVTPLVEAEADFIALEPEHGPREAATGATMRAAREEGRELAK
jgi:membrane protein implicated in regulation of membrane protease activity